MGETSPTLGETRKRSMGELNLALGESNTLMLGEPSTPKLDEVNPTLGVVSLT